MRRVLTLACDGGADRRGRRALGRGADRPPPAAGPGIEAADLPGDAEIVQLPATILRLLGLSADGLDGESLAAILEDAAPAAGVTPAAPAREASEEPVYSEEEERQMVERLRDLGYE